MTDGFTDATAFPRGYSRQGVGVTLVELFPPGTSVKVAWIMIAPSTVGATDFNVTNGDGSVVYCTMRAPANGSNKYIPGFQVEDGLGLVSPTSLSTATVFYYDD